MLDVGDLIKNKTALPFTIKLEELSESLGRKVSISDQIAEVLRNLIVNGDLNPGDRIVESQVAKRLGVGQPTVREASPSAIHPVTRQHPWSSTGPAPEIQRQKARRTAGFLGPGPRSLYI